VPEPEPRAELAPWLADFIAQESQTLKVDQWVGRTAAAIDAEIAAVRHDAELQADVATAIREHWTTFLSKFALPQVEFHLVDAGQVFAVDFARRQLPLESLIQVYRVAQQSTWTYITDLVNEMPNGTIDHTAVLIYFWTRASAWIDRSITDSVELFQAELARVMAGTEAQRYDVVREVLAGDAENPRAISAALGGYALSAHHTAVVLESQSADAVDDLRRLATEVGRMTGVSNPLIVKPGGRRLWMWLGTANELDLRVLGDSEEAVRSEVAIGVGSSAYGLQGFALSHREASDALRVGRVTARRPGHLTCYTDIELTALLRCTPEVDRFVERALGPLTRSDVTTERIRETLEAYLVAGGNVDEASRELFVHRNTVRYRLTQAEELLGHKVARVNAQLAVALGHYQAYHAEPQT